MEYPQKKMAKINGWKKPRIRFMGSKKDRPPEGRMMMTLAGRAVFVMDDGLPRFTLWYTYKKLWKITIFNR